MARQAKNSLKAGIAVWVLVGLGAFGLWNHHSAGQESWAESARIDVLFSPNGGCTDRIVEEIGNAEKRVLVQCFYFTSKLIADAIVAAKQRGVDCVVIADKSQEKMTYGRLPVLRSAGVKVMTDDKHATANNKIILIDSTTIITGSLNYTKAAEERNAENMLVIKGHSDLFEKYLVNFKHHKAHSRKYKSS